MHQRLYRRKGPAARARDIKNRIQQDVVNDAFSLTAPITLTILSTSTTSESNALTSTAVTTSVLSTGITSTSTSSVISSGQTTTSAVTSSTLSSSASSIFVTSPVVLPLNPTTSASSSSSSVSIVPNTGALENNTTALPAGAVVGIVIAVVLALLAAVVFIMRKRYMKSRRVRRATAQSTWFDKLGKTGGNRSFAAPLENIPGRPQMSSPMQTDILAFPATTYMNSPTPVTAQSVPIPATGTSDSVAIVKFTFIPTLPDELSISNGEVVRVIQEYDDGWALCLTTRGVQGMVPLECLELQNADRLMGPEFRNSRRESSLAGSRR